MERTKAQTKELLLPNYIYMKYKNEHSNFLPYMLKEAELWGKLPKSSKGILEDKQYSVS